MKLSPRIRRTLFWVAAILLLVVLIKVLTFLVHLSVQLIILVVFILLVWAIYQAAKNKWF
jgi:hypothetical protein